MGRAKHQQMEHEGKVDHALNLCMQVGAAEECEIHPGTYLDSMEFFDYEELVEKIIDEVPGAMNGFNNRDEFVECVESAMEMAGDECGSCAKYRDS